MTRSINQPPSLSTFNLANISHFALVTDASRFGPISREARGHPMVTFRRYPLDVLDGARRWLDSTTPPAIAS